MTRFKRPELERHRPIRTFSGIFDSAPASRDDAARIQQGVALGYRVVDEYLREGEVSARRSSATQTGGSATESIPKAIERVVQYASDMTLAWLDYVRLAAEGRGPSVAPAAAPLQGFDLNPPRTGVASKPVHETSPAPTYPAQRSEALVTVAVRAKVTTEATVELKPGALARALVAHDLRASNSLLPRIGEITVTVLPDEARVRVGIVVPPEQPAATYSGLIVDEESNLPWGTITLRVEAA